MHIGGYFCKLVFVITALLVVSGCGRQTAEETIARKPPPVAIAFSGPEAKKTEPNPVYKHSVVPGGVHSSEQLAVEMATDPVVAKHYDGVKPEEMRPVTLAADKKAFVSYRVGQKIFWTKEKVTLKKGERVFTDGETSLRERCGNQVSDTPQKPVQAVAPSEGELDRSEVILAGILPSPMASLSNFPPLNYLGGNDVNETPYTGQVSGPVVVPGGPVAGSGSGGVGGFGGGGSGSGSGGGTGMPPTGTPQVPNGTSTTVTVAPGGPVRPAELPGIPKTGEAPILPVPYVPTLVSIPGNAPMPTNPMPVPGTGTTGITTTTTNGYTPYTPPTNPGTIVLSPPVIVGTLDTPPVTPSNGGTPGGGGGSGGGTPPGTDWIAPLGPPVLTETPEPSTLLLAGFGVAAMWATRRRRSSLL